MKRALGVAWPVLAMTLAAGCASTPRELYMVMPEEGKAGTLVVTLRDGREQVLHGDYQAMSVTGSRKEVFVGDAARLQQDFGPAVAALPKPPQSAVLYFLRDKVELTQQSRAVAEQVYQRFVDRQYPEVWIIGHTDTTGSIGYNDSLSVRRAEKVKQTLIKLGIPAANIVAKGKGKRDLPVKTPDNTDEPRNRRVEISVR